MDWYYAEQSGSNVEQKLAFWQLEVLFVIIDKSEIPSLQCEEISKIAAEISPVGQQLGQ
jgi:hypothetical protein